MYVYAQCFVNFVHSTFIHVSTKHHQWAHKLPLTHSNLLQQLMHNHSYILSVHALLKYLAVLIAIKKDVPGCQVSVDEAFSSEVLHAFCYLATEL